MTLTVSSTVYQQEMFVAEEFHLVRDVSALHAEGYRVNKKRLTTNKKIATD